VEYLLVVLLPDSRNCSVLNFLSIRTSEDRSEKLIASLTCVLRLDYWGW